MSRYRVHLLVTVVADDEQEASEAADVVAHLVKEGVRTGNKWGRRYRGAESRPVEVEVERIEGDR